MVSIHEKKFNLLTYILVSYLSLEVSNVPMCVIESVNVFKQLTPSNVPLTIVPSLYFYITYIEPLLVSFRNCIRLS